MTIVKISIFIFATFDNDNFMIRQCYKCNKYNFVKTCPICNEEESNIPLNPIYYPEFEYRSKGFLSDLFTKKPETKKLNNKLDSVLAKYLRFENPYFINYYYLSIQKNGQGSDTQKTFSDLTLFEQVLLNLGFSEIDEYPALLEKLIKSTEFSFKYKEFEKKTAHHFKDTIKESLSSWIEEKGDLFRYELPLFIYYIYDNELFQNSVLYDKKSNEPNLREHNTIFEWCEDIYYWMRVRRFQHTLEHFNPLKFLTIYSVDSLDGYEFEDFLVQLFRNKGWEVQATQKGRDQGADLFIESFGKKTVIQAKNYQGNVGNKAVQEVIAAKEFYNCNEGMVITNRYFTPSAKELAFRANIKLIDRDELQRYIDDYNSSIIEEDLESQED